MNLQRVEITLTEEIVDQLAGPYLRALRDTKQKYWRCTDVATFNEYGGFDSWQPSKWTPRSIFATVDRRSILMDAPIHFLVDRDVDNPAFRWSWIESARYDVDLDSEDHPLTALEVESAVQPTVGEWVQIPAWSSRTTS
ncbi:hypothetical protein CH296_20075 [Rhodococcus sp. 14-2496-1d]|uniref:hypothetical protein n=1 Tax=Rhodococcus sp. 14-2496-1d TaxID=2023146 RepID=UPI000B9B78B4|nr:hypothetical protein [Rhodococcus sp. 14-2496-1d]OZF27955.1 hypothetical protein CH296_20075 [Rhodococcus sp. 14-2496-1d]